jgi:hypothetical protein
LISLPTDAAVSVLNFNVQNIDATAFSPQLKSITLLSDDIEFDDDILVSFCNVLVIVGLHHFAQCGCLQWVSLFPDVSIFALYDNTQSDNHQKSRLKHFAEEAR